jgi:hypothetical protein
VVARYPNSTINGNAFETTLDRSVLSTVLPAGNATPSRKAISGPVARSGSARATDAHRHAAPVRENIKDRLRVPRR